MRQWLLIAFMFYLLPAGAHAAENFVKIRLPNGVSIDLPRNWIVLSGNQRITLDTAVESALDLSNRPHSKSSLPFAANYYTDDKRTAAMVNVRYYPDLTLTQNDANATTSQDVKELDEALRQNVPAGFGSIGMRLISWNGTHKTKINGLIVFVTEYERGSIKSTGNFRVRLIRVFLSNRSFTLTVSYLVSQEPLLRLITDRIIRSLVIKKS